MDEYFTCHACSHRLHIGRLKKRQTMQGDYCPSCAEFELCAACSEMSGAKDIVYRHDVHNYICTGCQNDYMEVAEYIKPLSVVVEMRRAA